MPNVTFFELPAADVERAMKFYGAVFGWSGDRMPGPIDYRILKTADPAGVPEAPGIMGGLMQRKDEKQPVTVSIDVPDLDAALVRISESGGTVVVPKFAVPGIGWRAFFIDSEGNIMGLSQTDAAAQ